LFPLGTSHPEYGQVEYREIVAAFEKKGFTVISEIRPKDTGWKVYAKKVIGQIDSLLKFGVKPADITVVGTSMGGYITKGVSSTLSNKDINYVLIGCCTDQDIQDDPDIQICGNILSIYEASDSLGQSCQKQKEYSTKPIPHYKEIKLTTGLKHGFLYKAMPDWIEPSAKWANRDYK
jgi:esterase/lipase